MVQIRWRPPRANGPNRIASGLTLPLRHFPRYFFLGGVAIFLSEGADAAVFGSLMFSRRTAISSAVMIASASQGEALTNHEFLSK